MDEVCAVTRSGGPLSGGRARRGAVRASRSAVPALAFALALAAGAGACRLSQDGVHPPDNRIFFPGGALVDPSGRWLYVVNSNSDLRYNGGTVAALDLHAVRADKFDDPMFAGTKDWGPCRTDPRYVPPASVDGTDERCCYDILDSNILNCDEQRYFRDTRHSTVAIGSFAAQPVMQTTASATGSRHMFVPVRGDTSITMIDVQSDPTKAELRCYGDYDSPAEAPSRTAPCDKNWRVTKLPEPDGNEMVDEATLVPLSDEPYALAIDDLSQLLYVGHLRGGQVSLLDLDASSNPKQPAKVVQVFGGLFPGDANGLAGITSLTIKSPGCFGGVYASSRYRPLVNAFVVYGLSDCPRPVDQPGTRSVAIVGPTDSLSTGLSGSQTRGIAFVRPGDAADGSGGNIDRTFILQRTPPAVVALDAATQLPFATVEVCQGPTNLAQHRDATGRTLALFVTCFDAGEVYVIDPWEPRVRTVISVGRGPISTVLPPQGLTDPVDASRAYVVGFGGNNVVVIDLAEGSRTQYHVVQRIGFSSATPREVGPQ